MASLADLARWRSDDSFDVLSKRKKYNDMLLDPPPVSQGVVAYNEYLDQLKAQRAQMEESAAYRGFNAGSRSAVDPATRRVLEREELERKRERERSGISRGDAIAHDPDEDEYYRSRTGHR